MCGVTWQVPTLSISGLMKELQDEKTNITSIRERLPQMITELGLAGYDEASQEMSLEEMEEIFTPKQHVKRLVTGEGSGTKPLVYQGEYDMNCCIKVRTTIVTVVSRRGRYELFYQGRPGVDFPVLPSIPRTDFSCRQVKHSGYYADLDTDCQVFHICADGRKISFLCPNGTIFRQSHLICDWWWTVDCASSKEHYEESAEQLANDQKVYRARADALAQSRSRQQVGRKPGVIREQESGDRQGRVISNERPRQLTYTNVRRANNGRQGRVLGSTQESETQRSNSPFQTPFSTARPRNFQPGPFPTPFSPSAASQQISTEQQFDIKQPSESRQPTGNLQLPEDLIPPQESQFESNRDFEQSENYSDQLVGLKPPPEKLILIVPNQQPQQTKQRSDFLQRNLPSSDRSFQRQTNQNKDSLQNRQPKLNSDFEQNRSPFRNQQVPQDQQRFPAVLPTPNRPLPQLRPSQPTRRPVTPPQQNRPSQEFRPTPQTRSSQTNRFDSNRQQLEIQNTRFSTNTQLSEPQDFLRSQNALRAFQFDQLQKQEQELHSSNGTKTYNHVRYFGSETEQQQPAETGSFVGNRGNNLLLNSGQQQPFRPPFRNADNIKQKERLRFLGSPTTARNIVSTQKVASFEKSFADKHKTRVTPKPILEVALSRRVKPTVTQSFNRSSLVRNLVKNESETPIMEPEPPLNLRFSDEDDFEQAITEQEPPEGREFIDEDEFLNGITEPTPLSGEEFTEEEFTNSTETGQSLSEDLEEEDSEDDDFEDENQSNEEEAIIEPQPPEGKSFTSEDDSNNESKELALDLEPPFESSTVEYVSEEDIDSTNSSFPLTTPQTTSRKSRFRAQKSSLTTTTKIPSATSSTTVRSTRRKQLNVTPISNESMSSEEHSDLGEVNSENVTLTTDLEPPFDEMIIDIPKKHSSVLTSATIESSKSALRTSRFRTRTSTQSESSSETTTAPISTLAIGLSRRVKPAVVKSKEQHFQRQLLPGWSNPPAEQEDSELQHRQTLRKQHPNL
uniref:Chitin-binding type-2 domain-containing protein n=1 Tax=Timema cristinae TaxID=61476 RepID=A0A7R9D0H5_TIMCR|nr:unnamed protein product [Timema cristinae]